MLTDLLMNSRMNRMQMVEAIIAHYCLGWEWRALQRTDWPKPMAVFAPTMDLHTAEKGGWVCRGVPRGFLTTCPTLTPESVLWDYQGEFESVADFYLPGYYHALGTPYIHGFPRCLTEPRATSMLLEKHGSGLSQLMRDPAAPPSQRWWAAKPGSGRTSCSGPTWEIAASLAILLYVRGIDLTNVVAEISAETGELIGERS